MTLIVRYKGFEAKAETEEELESELMVIVGIGDSGKTLSARQVAHMKQVTRAAVYNAINNGSLRASSTPSGITIDSRDAGAWKTQRERRGIIGQRKP